MPRLCSADRSAAVFPSLWSEPKPESPDDAGAEALVNEGAHTRGFPV